jgi:hypothetical protein
MPSIFDLNGDGQVDAEDGKLLVILSARISCAATRLDIIVLFMLMTAL